MHDKAKAAERRPAGFGQRLMALVIPITMQNLTNAGVGAADVFMLSFVNQTAIAGVGVAMGNGDEAFKRAADDVAGRVRRGGVAGAFGKYGLYNRHGKYIYRSKIWQKISERRRGE